jgi:hypothetical protein
MVGKHLYSMYLAMKYYMGFWTPKPTLMDSKNDKIKNCASEKQGEKQEKMCGLVVKLVKLVKSGPVRPDNWQLRACTSRRLP